MVSSLVLCCTVFMLLIPVSWSSLLFSRRPFRFLPHSSPVIQLNKLRVSKLSSRVKQQVKRQLVRLKISWVRYKKGGVGETATAMSKAMTTAMTTATSTGTSTATSTTPSTAAHLQTAAIIKNITAPLIPPSSSTSSSYDLQPLLTRAQQYLSAVQWDPLGTANNIQVFRAQAPIVTQAEERKWSCFKTLSVVNCSMTRLYDSLMDTEKILQYSEWTASREEVERLDSDTAVTWSRAKPVLNMKPHDFCSLSHTVRVDERTIMVISQSVKHPKAPPQKDHSRSEILFSLNLLKDITPTNGHGTAGDDGAASADHVPPPQTELITISHVSYTGVYPFLVNRRAYQGIIDFMTALDSFATRTEQQQA